MTMTFVGMSNQIRLVRAVVTQQPGLKRTGCMRISWRCA